VGRVTATCDRAHGPRTQPNSREFHNALMILKHLRTSFINSSCPSNREGFVGRPRGLRAVLFCLPVRSPDAPCSDVLLCRHGTSTAVDRLTIPSGALYSSEILNMTRSPQNGVSPRRTRAIQIVLVLILLVGTVWIVKSGMLGVLSHKDRLIGLLREDGWRGPLVCIGAQFVQVVIFIIPGEITQLAAGYVFGLWRGFLYSVVGILAGSAFNFYFARVVGRPVIERVVGPAVLVKVDRVLENAKGKSAMFLLFLLPGAPKDALSYGAGLTEMSLTEFLVVSTLGRAPAQLASILIGSHASQKNYGAMVATGVAVLLAGAGYYWYERRRRRASRQT